MKIKKYKCNNVNTLQSHIQKSVENKEALTLLQKKFSPYPYGDPMRTNLLINVLQTSDVKVNASIQPVAKLNLKILMSLK